MSSASPSPNSPVAAAAPPPANPPTTATPPPPPATVIPPPPPSETPPMASEPPNSSPPQPIAPPPKSPSPPDAPPANSPPPPEPTNPPPNSPPPPSSPPPETSPPPPSPPPIKPPPPPSKKPPENSPPPPQKFPPPPSPKPPPQNPPPPPPPPSPPPPKSGPTPVPSPPPSPPPTSESLPESPPRPRPPPPPATQSKPPPPVVLPPPRHSPPSPASIAPPDISTTNNSNSTETQNPQYSGSGSISKGGIVAIVLVLVFIILGIVGSSACRAWKRKKKSSGHGHGYIMPTFLASPQDSASALLKVQMQMPGHKKGGIGSVKGIVYSPPQHRVDFVNSRSCFTYKELVEATHGFSAHNLLGEGGFGYVYKGRLADGREIAVKQLKIGGGQGEREFRSEVEIISRIHHRHLVSLVGYCIYEKRRLLVYAYVSNNNLHFHLHGEGKPALDWAARVKIAIGAARGIAYLHEDCHPRIIHRDIKSSNILLDNNFEARVSDFGLAKLMDSNTHVTTRVMGTFGYMAPEYASSGKLTDKSDVFSYGVVLLELITGRKPVDTSQPLGEESLVEWARPLLSHALETQDYEGLADPRLERQYVDCEMFRMIEAAASCVRHSSAKRPKMGQVVRALDCMASTDLTNGMRVGESEMFNYEDQSAEIRLFRRMAFGSQDYSTGFFNQNSWGSSGNQVNSRRL